MRLTKTNFDPKKLGNGIVSVLEIIPLKPEFSVDEATALAAGQAYEDAADHNAHVSAGHIDHAHFFFRPPMPTGRSGELILFYPWADAESLLNLLTSEESVLTKWFDKYASGPREVVACTELPVEV